MVQQIKIERIGDSIGIVLPDEVLAKLGVDEGDTVSITETADGVCLSVKDPRGVEQRQLEAADRVMRKNREMLRKLAQ